jgi:hypothetical protein
MVTQQCIDSNLFCHTLINSYSKTALPENIILPSQIRGTQKTCTPIIPSLAACEAMGLNPLSCRVQVANAESEM